MLDPTIKHLSSLKGLLSAYILLLDGLDECNDWPMLLQSLNMNPLPNVKFILSSQDMEALRKLIIGEVEDNSKKAIKVTSKEDIKTFIR